MFNSITCIVASLALVSAVPAPGSDDINGKVNELVSLTLDGNPSTGSSWMIEGLPNELVYIDTTTADDTYPGANGIGGSNTKTTLNFYANNAGHGTLRLIYGQPWDKTYWQQKAYTVNIGN